MARQVLTALSAFTGLGGLDLGLEAAGFTPLGCIENDPVARRSLKLNRNEWHLLDPPDIEHHAETLRPDTLGLGRRDLTLLCGAPPCQPYSKAAMWQQNAWNGFDDDRAKPLLAFFQLLEAFLPEVVLMENVQGFVSGPRSVAPLLDEAFAEVNERAGTQYSMSMAVLNAADFGVPQRRRRAIVVAFRSGGLMQWPVATHAALPVRAWDALCGIEPADPDPAIGKWADLLPSIPEGENYLWHTSRGGGLPLFGYRTRFWSFLLKLAKDRPAWTLPAQPGPSTGPFHWDSRPLTPLEALRLQTFPTDWSVEGGAREQVRQVGNATPPLLAEVLGRAVLNSLGRPCLDRPLNYLISQQPVVPPPERATLVPDAYLHLVGDHPDHPGEGAGPNPRPV